MELTPKLKLAAAVALLADKQKLAKHPTKEETHHPYWGKNEEVTTCILNAGKPINLQQQQ